MSLDLEFRAVHLDYHGDPALRGLSFHLPGGTLCGLLGRNGSGKTSLLSLVGSLFPPSAGEILVGGADPFESSALMAQIGLIGDPGDAGMYRVRDVLELAKTLRPTWDDAYARRLLDRFDVPRNKTIKTLSRGTRAALGCTATCPSITSRSPGGGEDMIAGPARTAGRGTRAGALGGDRPRRGRRSRVTDPAAAGQRPDWRTRRRSRSRDERAAGTPTGCSMLPSWPTSWSRAAAAAPAPAGRRAFDAAVERAVHDLAG